MIKIIIFVILEGDPGQKNNLPKQALTEQNKQKIKHMI